MEKQLKELLLLLDAKAENDNIVMYEEGMRDILTAIVHEDGNSIDEMIEETKED